MLFADFLCDRSALYLAETRRAARTPAVKIFVADYRALVYLTAIAPVF
ncbi:MAG: hypothetical protein GDA53_00965 [Rhodobacteraceae bacterium]|nr:hypothetical protein [Paracoccaceae bacterium]